MNPAQAKQSGASGKKKEQDALLLEVFPKSESTDLDAVERSIRNVSIEGVSWFEDPFPREELAYGLKKLHVQALITNRGVDTTHVQNKLLSCVSPGGKPLVGSVEFRALGKYPC